jgi:hypothetical protein
MKDKKLKKENDRLREVLSNLIDAADRVSNKFGMDDNDKPMDWTEWRDLRIAIIQARSARNK